MMYAFKYSGRSLIGGDTIQGSVWSLLGGPYVIFAPITIIVIDHPVTIGARDNFEDGFINMQPMVRQNRAGDAFFSSLLG